MGRTTRIGFRTVGELLERLGDIPAYRVRLRPPPGKATERDVVIARDREKRLCELIEGTLVEKPMGFLKSCLAAEILGELRDHVRRHDLGIVSGADGTVRLLQGLVRIPDVAFFSWERLPTRELPADPIPDLVPDLAVEVLSEGNTPGEMHRKLKDYFLAGVRLVWFIDPGQRQAEVFTAPDRSTTVGAEGTLDGGSVLPGLSLALSTLFRRLPSPSPSASKPRRRKQERNP